jgi:hypothetical protein
MAHFAKVIDGIVQQVIVAEQEIIDSGIVGDSLLWVKTSYNTKNGVYYEPNSDIPAQDQSKALRKNFAGIGFTYDSERDAFIPPKPFESWTLNENTCNWDAPTIYPNDGKHYTWNEETLTWTEVTGK